MSTDAPALDLHHITRLPSGNYRVRVQIKGVWHGNTHTDPEFAIVERDALLSRQPARKKNTWSREEWIRQKEAQPPGTSFRNIYQSASGCYVKLGRGFADVYGKHFVGPHAVTQALAYREELEAQYPKTR